MFPFILIPNLYLGVIVRFDYFIPFPFKHFNIVGSGQIFFPPILK